jgi:hypothetical protein
MTTAELAHRAALVITEKAQKALNLAMKANPYVIMATVLAGLVATMWALHDSTSEEEEVQKRLNDLMEASKEKKDKLISTTDELTRKIKDESATIYEQIKAWKLLQAELPELYVKMTIEEFKNLTVEQIKHMNAVAADTREIEEANKQYEKAIRNLTEYNEAIKVGGGTAKAATNDTRKELEAEAEAARRATEEIAKAQREAEFQSKPAAERLAYYERELSLLKDAKKQLEEMILNSEDVNNRWKLFNLETAINVGKLGSVNDKINEISGSISALKEDVAVKQYGDAYKGAKKDWEDAKKELKKIEEDKDKFTLEQYNNAKKREESAKKAYKDLGGEVDTTAAEKRKRETEKINEMRLRAERSIAEREREIYVSRGKEKLDNEQKLLNIEKDSFARRLKQNKLNYDKELAEISQQANEKLKKAEEYAKDLYAKEKGKEAGFDFSKFDKTKLPEDLRPENIAKWATEANEIAGKVFENDNMEMLKSLVDQYKNYTQQREAIEKKFNDDISALRDERKKAEEKDDAAMVAQLESAIAQATKNKGKELISFDFDILQKNPEYVRAFENLKNTSTETLTELLF